MNGDPSGRGLAGTAGMGVRERTQIADSRPGKDQEEPMPASPVELRGVTWSHTRGYTPMAATAQRFEELNPGVRINWDRRSLQAFADQPIDQLAEAYDLLVIDHPWAGFAAAGNIIVPLDNCLPEAYLRDQAEHSVGRSHESYCFGGKQWALAIDAATPVASYRSDLLETMGCGPPSSWDELMALAEAGVVAVPGIPQDTLMNFYMLCSTLGEDPCQREGEVVSPDVGTSALRLLRGLSQLVDSTCFDRNPIQIYEAMTQTDEIVYCPFAYGYSNYAQEGYARTRLTFSDMVWIEGTDKCRSTLGGTGLAISGRCRNREAAAAYVQYVAAPDTQSGIYFRCGGQPGHRSAWLNKATNEKSLDYFKNTLPALDRAFLRPRYLGHMAFQDNAGSPIREFLMRGGDEAGVLDHLNALYVQSRQES